jgi:hypothetical protein
MSIRCGVLHIRLNEGNVYTRNEMNTQQEQYCFCFRPAV